MAIRQVLVACAVCVLGLGLSASVPVGAATNHRKHHPAPTVGHTFVVENEQKQYEAVTLVAVIDPAQGADQYTTPDPGKRFVGIELKIRNRSSGTDTNDANNNTTLVGSNDQDYTPDFFSLAECTNFDNGQYTLAQGQSVTGCVTFEVPTGVRITRIRYNPNSGFSTNNVSWVIPKSLA